jgi:ABC-2 type transport system ATP-binding protein
VVDGLGLEVRRDEVFGFLGPHGAGQTTAMAMILAPLAPHDGQIAILGHDALTDRAAALRRAEGILGEGTSIRFTLPRG